jgi:tryptophan halogenase
VQTHSTGTIMPYTRSVAHADGWRWRIPLQSRVGNGLIYASGHLSDDQAHERLMGSLDAPNLNQPRLIKYKTGCRKKLWNKNCIAIGLSSGFIEPLESTSIHLFQRSVLHLIQNFPFFGISDALVQHYNELSRNEIEYARDFVVLHYKLNQRTDSAFWKERADMAVPDSLQQRIDLFRESGVAYQGQGELFATDSWIQVMMGQRLEPQGWHRLGALMSRDELGQVFDGLKKTVDHTVASLQTHDAFLKEYCQTRVGM